MSSNFNDGLGETSTDSGEFNSDGTNMTLDDQTFAVTHNGDVLTLVNADELQIALAHIKKHEANVKIAYEDIIWALINTKEFQLFL